MRPVTGLEEAMQRRWDNFSAPEFLRALKARDRSAITKLVNTYTPHLCRAAMGQNFPEDQVEEIVQATWQAFFDAIERFEGRSHVCTYVLGILYNKIREKRREFARIQDSDEIERLIDEKFDSHGWWKQDPRSPDEAIAAMETMEIIRRCMDGLPHNQRTAFHLREVQGEDTETICNIMEVSSTNLGVLLYRARNKLRECISACSPNLGARS